MASLHPAAGSPAVFDHRVFAHTHNPFLKFEPEPAPLRPANQAAPFAESVEVTVLWGTNVLAVEQLTPPRAYAVGEVGGAHGAGTSPAGNVDFALSAERLGSPRRQIMALRHGVAFAIFDSNETPRLLEKGQAVDADGIVVDCSDVAPGARGIELRQERVVIIEASGVSFRLAGMEKMDRVPRAILGSTDRSALTTMGTAAILQGLLVASLAYLTPSMAWGSDEELNRDRLELMQQYLHAQAERNREEQPQPSPEAGGEKGAPAPGSKGPEGQSGRPDAPSQPRRLAIAGHAQERNLSRAELRAAATEFGTIGLLNAMNASNAPSSPWGAEATGPDAVNAHGDLFSQELGDTFGYGVGLSGTGIGAGGPGTGVGMGNIGTCMGINCYGNGKDGFGRSGALTKRGEHVSKGPRIASSPPTLSGHLPPEVIQRIVRQNFGRFRACYQMGLTQNPNLEGRVTARFIIGRDGAVSNVSAGGDLPDAKVTSCVGSAFYGLSFPPPDVGIVTVSYPIMLTPG